jgi:hypothetical protein
MAHWVNSPQFIRPSPEKLSGVTFRMPMMYVLEPKGKGFIVSS